MREDFPNPEIPPAEFPQQSVTIRTFYKGYSMLVTMRDPTQNVSPLVEKAMGAVDWMEKAGFKPDWRDAEAPDNTPAKVEGEMQGRDAWSPGGEQPKCKHCGADMILGKKGNYYCKPCYIKWKNRQQ